MSDQKVIFYRDCLSRIMSISLKFEFDSNDEATAHIFTLLSSSIELLDNMCILLLNESKIGIPILLRAMLEATVDIQFILKDKENYKRIKIKDLLFWEKIYKCAYSGNDYVKHIRDDPSFKIDSKSNATALKELRNSGVKEAHISEKFKNTILADTYNSIYAILCSHAHNGKSVQYERHFTTQYQNNRIDIFKNIPIEQYMYFLHYAACFLFISIDYINKAFKYELHDDINELKEMLSNKERDLWRQ